MKYKSTTDQHILVIMLILFSIAAGITGILTSHAAAVIAQSFGYGVNNDTSVNIYGFILFGCITFVGFFIGCLTLSWFNRPSYTKKLLIFAIAIFVVSCLIVALIGELFANSSNKHTLGTGIVLYIVFAGLAG